MFKNIFDTLGTTPTPTTTSKPVVVFDSNGNLTVIYIQK